MTIKIWSPYPWWIYETYMTNPIKIYLDYLFGHNNWTCYDAQKIKIFPRYK